MKRKLQVACAVLAAITLVGCGSSKYDSYAPTASESYSSAYDSYGDYGAEAAEVAWEEEWEEEAPLENAKAEKVDESSTSNRKLIRTLNIDVETYNFEELTGSISDKVASLGGYIENSSVDGNVNSSRRSASYTIRIPAASADQFVSVLQGKSNITHQSESVEDVTLSYVDIQSRKDSLQIEYDRLQEMLGSADTVEDMIYIEDRLSNVRYEIQSIESQLRTYDNKINYTTIYLDVEEVKVYTEPEPEDDSIGGRIKRGLADAGENIVDFLSGLIVGIVVAIPYLIMVAVVVGIPAFIIIKIIRACQKRSAKKAEKKRAQAAITVEKEATETLVEEVTEVKTEE